MLYKIANNRYSVEGVHYLIAKCKTGCLDIYKETKIQELLDIGYIILYSTSKVSKYHKSEKEILEYGKSN